MHCRDQVWPVFGLDDDTSFFLFFVSTIRDELYGPAGGMNVRNEFRAIIRGGEHVVQVQDDKSLMRMFRLNSNAKDDIVVQVMEIPTVPLPLLQIT